MPPRSMTILSASRGNLSRRSFREPVIVVRDEYLYIGTLGVNVRICRGQGREPRHGARAWLCPCSQSVVVNSASRSLKLWGNPSRRATGDFARPRKEPPICGVS